MNANGTKLKSHSSSDNPFYIKSEQNKEIKQNENKIEQKPIKELDLNNIKDPFSNVIETNTIISESKNKDINQIKEINNINKSESENFNLNPIIGGSSKLDENQDNNEIDDDIEFNTESIIGQLSRENPEKNENENNNNLNNAQKSENNILNNNDKVEKEITQNNSNDKKIESNPKNFELTEEPKNINLDIANSNNKMEKKEIGEINPDILTEINECETVIKNKEQVSNVNENENNLIKSESNQEEKNKILSSNDNSNNDINKNHEENLNLISSQPESNINKEKNGNGEENLNNDNSSNIIVPSLTNIVTKELNIKK